MSNDMTRNPYILTRRSRFQAVISYDPAIISNRHHPVTMTAKQFAATYREMKRQNQNASVFIATWRKGQRIYIALHEVLNLADGNCDEIEYEEFVY